jgi:hypothetical protein
MSDLNIYKNYSQSVFLILISVFLFFFLSYDFTKFILNFKDYTQIAFVDHDQAYLIEQLLIKINFPNIEMVTSDILEYGVEFYYLQYLIKFINFFNKLEVLDVFYITSLFHYFCGFLAIMFSIKILQKFKVEQFIIVLFLLCIVSSGYFIRSLSLLKPDANIFILCLVLYVYFIILFLDKNKIQYFFISIFFLTLSIAIKYFGIFLVPTLFLLKSDFSKYKKNYIYRKQNLLFNLNLILIFIWLYNVLIFISENYYYKINIEIIRSYILPYILYYLLFGYTAIYFLYILILQKIISSNNFFILNTFIFFLIIISTPFIYDYQSFLSSVYGQFQYSNYVENYENIQISRNFKNFFLIDIKWNLLNISGFISIIIVVFPLLFKKFKYDKKIQILYFLLIYFISVYFFMPFILPGERLYNIRYSLYLFSIIIIFIFPFCLKENVRNYSKVFLVIFTLFTFLENQTNYNYYKNLDNYQNLHANLNTLQKQTSQFENIINCDGFFPNIKNNKKYFYYNPKKCFQKISQKFDLKDLYIFSKTNSQEQNLNKILNLKKNNIISVEKKEIKVVNIYGKNSHREYFFITKKN